MLLLFDRASMERTLTLDLDSRLHALLSNRIASLVTADHDLTDYTELVVVQRGDAEADFIREIGFSPLIEPIDGARFGGAGFRPYWDHLARHEGWFELVITFGSTFAYILLIPDGEDTFPELLAMCRRFAGSGQ